MPSPRARAAVPEGWRAQVQKALDRAKVFDDGSDGADGESACSVVAILTALLAAAPQPRNPNLCPNCKTWPVDGDACSRCGRAKPFDSAAPQPKGPMVPSLIVREYLDARECYDATLGGNRRRPPWTTKEAAARLIAAREALSAALDYPQPAGETLKWTNPAPHASAPREPSRSASYSVGFKLDDSRVRTFAGEPAPSALADVEALAKAVLDARSHIGPRRPDDPDDAQYWDLLTEAARRLSEARPNEESKGETE